MNLEGQSPNGSIFVDEEWVTIIRKNIKSKLNLGEDGEKRIAISSIIAVQFRGVGKYGSVMGRLSKSASSPNAPATGLIQFMVMGEESKRGLISAQFDENSLQFNSIGQPDFERIRDFIQRRINERR